MRSPLPVLYRLLQVQQEKEAAAYRILDSLSRTNLNEPGINEVVQKTRKILLGIELEIEKTLNLIQDAKGKPMKARFESGVCMN